MTLIFILTIIVCILLTLIVVIQNPKGGGIAANFSAGNQIMGVRKTNDFVEKATWTLAGALLVLAMTSSFIAGSGTKVSQQQSILQDKIISGELGDDFQQGSNIQTLETEPAKETEATK